MSENKTRSNTIKPFTNALFEAMSLGTIFTISITILTNDSWENVSGKYPLLVQKICSPTFLGNFCLVLGILLAILLLITSFINFILSRATESSLATFYGVKIVFISSIIIPLILFLCNLKWITEQFIVFYAFGWMLLYIFLIMYSEKTMVRNRDI